VKNTLLILLLQLIAFGGYTQNYEGKHKLYLGKSKNHAAGFYNSDGGWCTIKSNKQEVRVVGLLHNKETMQTDSIYIETKLNHQILFSESRSCWKNAKTIYIYVNIPNQNSKDGYIISVYDKKGGKLLADCGLSINPE